MLQTPCINCGKQVMTCFSGLCICPHMYKAVPFAVVLLLPHKAVPTLFSCEDTAKRVYEVQGELKLNITGNKTYHLQDMDVAACMHRQSSIQNLYTSATYTTFWSGSYR